MTTVGAGSIPKPRAPTGPVCTACHMALGVIVTEDGNMPPATRQQLCSACWVTRERRAGRMPPPP